MSSDISHRIPLTMRLQPLRMRPRITWPMRRRQIFSPYLKSLTPICLFTIQLLYFYIATMTFKGRLLLAPLIMAALCNRAGRYILILWFLSSIYLLSSTFFPRLISAVADWMSTIHAHMVWPYCEFNMQVWNVLHGARCKYRTQKVVNRHLVKIAQLCRATSSQLRHVSTIGKKTC